MKSLIKSKIFLALEILLLLSIVLVVLLPYSPQDQALPSRDSGVFLYTGWRVLSGEVPYLQIWDHKPPVIYYLDAIGLMVSPDSNWGVWVVEFVSLSLAVVAGYFVLKKLFGIFTALFISFLWPFTAFYLLAGGNLTTEYVLPFQFAIIFFFWKMHNDAVTGWAGFLLGISSAFLFFTRQNAIAIPIAASFVLLSNGIRGKDFKRFRRESGAIIAGAFLVTGCVVGYFAYKGALLDLWEIAFRYNFDYVEEKGIADSFIALFSGLNQLENLGLAQLGFIGWGMALAFLTIKPDRISHANRPVIWLAVIAMPLELWLVSMGGRPRLPYFLVLLPIFTVCAGFAIWLLFESLQKDIPKYYCAILTIFFVVSLGSVFWSDYDELLQDFTKATVVPEIITYIQENSLPEDYVLMWGADTSYNFVTRRASPTRFVYQTPLYNEKNKDNIVEFLQAILTKRPRLIILDEDERLSDFRFGYRDNQIGALMDQVKALYNKSVSVGSWQVFQYSGN